MQTLTKFLAALALVMTLGLIADPADAAVFTAKGIGGATGAGDGALMKNLDTATKNTLGRTQQVIYGAAGFGALALGVLAFFGRFQWTWFFGIVGGLVLIAGIQQGIEYLTGDATALAINVN